ncbi:MAG: MFS transporter [bacterium]
MPPAARSAPTAVRQRVLGFTLAVTAIAYLDRVCISMAAPAMKADLGISDVEMGWVFSAFTFAYALFEVPSGWLADRFGARLMLTRIVVWWSALTAATGAAAGFTSLLAIRFLFGVGEAGAFPSMARTYARWLPERERGRAFGLTLMAGALGGALTQPLVVALLGWMHWRHTFVLFGAVGLVWAVAWFWWFRDDPHDHAAVNAAELRLIGSTPLAPHAGVPWSALLRDRNLIALCLMYLFAIYGWYFYLTWLPTYLLRARGFDLKQVGWLAALPLLSIAVGVLVGGWASDILSRRWGPRAGRRSTGLVGFPLAALAIVAGVLTPTPVSSALCFAAAAGLAALGVSPAWAVCLEIGGRHAGVVSGAMNTFGNLGGALSPVVIGFTLERSGWTPSLLSIAVSYLLAAACWLRIDPTRVIDLGDDAGGADHAKVDNQNTKTSDLRQSD